jgi:hypothetical protein
MRRGYLYIVNRQQQCAERRHVLSCAILPSLAVSPAALSARAETVAHVDGRRGMRSEGFEDRVEKLVEVEGRGRRRSWLGTCADDRKLLRLATY